MNDRSCDICQLPVDLTCVVQDYKIYGRRDRHHMFLSSEQRAASADELYDGSYFRGAGGSGYVDYLQQKKSLVARGRRYAGLGSRLLGRSGRLLDIGAAAGFTMAGCRDSGWDVEGVEPNLTMVEYGRDAEALTFHHGCIDDVDFSARYDCILFLQVLEHIGDPVSTLRKALSILNPGGIVIVETWNVNSWPAKFLKHRWHQCNPPSVVHWYSPGSLTKLFGKEGFRLAGIGRPFKTTPVSNAIALLTSKLPFIRHLKPITIRALAGVSLPYPPVDVFWAAYTLRE